MRCIFYIHLRQQNFRFFCSISTVYMVCNQIFQLNYILDFGFREFIVCLDYIKLFYAFKNCIIFVRIRSYSYFCLVSFLINLSFFVLIKFLKAVFSFLFILFICRNLRTFVCFPWIISLFLLYSFTYFPTQRIKRYILFYATKLVLSLNFESTLQTPVLTSVK